MPVNIVLAVCDTAYYMILDNVNYINISKRQFIKLKHILASKGRVSVKNLKVEKE